MSYQAVALVMALIVGVSAALIAAGAVMLHVAQRRRLLAGLTPQERLALPRDLFWRDVFIGLAVAVVVALTVWFIAVVVPQGECAGDDESGDCSDVHRTL